MAKDNVKFIRKNGRIIPIKSNSKKGRELKKVQKKNTRDLLVSTAALGGSIVAGEKSMKFRNQSLRLRNESIGIAKGAVTRKSKTLANEAVSRFQRGKKLFRKSGKLGLVSNVLLGVSALALGSGISRTNKFKKNLNKNSTSP